MSINQGNVSAFCGSKIDMTSAVLYLLVLLCVYLPVCLCASVLVSWEGQRLFC